MLAVKRISDLVELSFLIIHSNNYVSDVPLIKETVYKTYSYVAAKSIENLLICLSVHKKSK